MNDIMLLATPPADGVPHGGGPLRSAGLHRVAGAAWRTAEAPVTAGSGFERLLISVTADALRCSAGLTHVAFGDGLLHLYVSPWQCSCWRDERPPGGGSFWAG